MSQYKPRPVYPVAFKAVVCQGPITKRPMPRSQREWDKVDIEAELKKVDEMESTRDGAKVLRNPSNPFLQTEVDVAGEKFSHFRCLL